MEPQFFIARCDVTSTADEHALTLRRHVFTHGPLNPSAAWKASPPGRTFTQQVGTGRPGGVRVSVQAGRPLLDTHQDQWRHSLNCGLSLRLSKKKKKDPFFLSNSNMYALLSHNVSTLLPSSRLGFPLFRVQILPQMAHQENVLCVYRGMLTCGGKNVITKGLLYSRPGPFEYFSQNISWGPRVTTIDR